MKIAIYFKGQPDSTTKLDGFQAAFLRRVLVIFPAFLRLSPVAVRLSPVDVRTRMLILLFSFLLFGWLAKPSLMGSTLRLCDLETGVYTIVQFGSYDRRLQLSAGVILRLSPVAFGSRRS